MNFKEAAFEIPLRWGDMDAMGHLNNVVYFRLLEESRAQWLAQLGFAALPTNEAPIVAHVACDFLKAMNYPGTALIKQSVVKVGRSSVELVSLIERSDEPNVIYAKGRAVVVWYDYTRAQPQPWPDSIRALIA